MEASASAAGCAAGMGVGSANRSVIFAEPSVNPELRSAEAMRLAALFVPSCCVVAVALSTAKEKCARAIKDSTCRRIGSHFMVLRSVDECRATSYGRDYAPLRATTWAFRAALDEDGSLAGSLRDGASDRSRFAQAASESERGRGEMGATQPYGSVFADM